MKSSVPALGIAVVLAAMIFTVFSVMAQAQGGKGSTGGSHTQTEVGTQDTASQGPLELGLPVQDVRRPLFLQGSVVIDDGTPTPSSIVIERVCSGRRIPEGRTDSKGRFHFEVGRSESYDADRSNLAGDGFSHYSYNGSTGYGVVGLRTGIGITERELRGCSLRAVYPGYISSSVELAVPRVFDNPFVGTIILEKLGERTGFTTSGISQHAPKKAKKAFKKAAKHAEEQSWDKAEQELNKAIEFYPEYAEAWFNLGQVNETQQRPEDAREAYAKALRLDPQYYQPYINLAMMDARENRWQDVSRTTDKVLQANPYEFPEAYFLNSLANLNLNRSAAAEERAREAVEMGLAEGYPQVEYMLGLALARRNNFDEASTHLQRYLEMAPNAPNISLVRKQLDQVENSRSNQPSRAAPAQVGTPNQTTPQP